MYQLNTIIEVKIERIVDGDTVVAYGEFEPGIKESRYIRFFGINAPEKTGDTEIAGLESMKALMEKINKTKCYCRLETDAQDGDYEDHFDRILGTIFQELRNGNLRNINRWLVGAGFAEKYTYKKRKGYRPRIKRA